MATSDLKTLAINRVKDTEVYKVFEQVRDILRAMQLQAFAGTTVAVTFTAASTQAVSHGLGRTPQGFLVVDAELSAPELYRGTWDARTASISHAGAASTRVKLRFY